MGRDVNTVRESGVYTAWIAALKDLRSKAFLIRRLNRAREGSFGKAESVGGGVYEMKCDFGPGYRLQFSQIGKGIYQALCGGDKSSQAEDVKYAKVLKAAMEKEHAKKSPR
jgi:putative addiction module killer protein